MIKFNRPSTKSKRSIAARQFERTLAATRAHLRRLIVPAVVESLRSSKLPTAIMRTALRRYPSEYINRRTITKIWAVTVAEKVDEPWCW